MSKLRKMKRAVAQNEARDEQVDDPDNKPELRGVVAHIACPECDRVYRSRLELFAEGTETEITGESSAATGTKDRIRCNESIVEDYRSDPLRVAA